MKKISAEIVADSINPQGNRITTMLLTYPRFIHGEVLTHRVFSRNSASSRAIPFEKMVKMVEEDPFIPIAWQKDHKGMQGSEYITQKDDIESCVSVWLKARDNAIKQAICLNGAEGFEPVTKQLCNRLLEPFMWTTMLITGSKEGWQNFFELRCPSYLYDYEDKPIYFKSKKDWVNYYNESQGFKEKNHNFIKVEDIMDLEWLEFNKGQAEIHMQALAEAIYDAMRESTPKRLKAGEWHIPFGDNIQESGLHGTVWTKLISPEKKDLEFCKVKVAVARCARLSYMTFDGEIDYEKDIKLHDRLLSDGHMSPFEHCARAMNNAEYESFYKGQIGLGGESGWCNNFRGFIQYRYLVENDYENNNKFY